MKTILYMAITANGIIAGEKDNVSWISQDAWKSYMEIVKSIDCMIIGRRTYEVMPEEEFKDCDYVVFTSQKNLKKKGPKIRFVSEKPKEVLKLLEEEGKKRVCICGGAQINSLFMKENLIDEVFLDLEPVFLGKGVKLFADSDFETKLELLEVKKMSDNLVQLHYKVLK